MAESLRREGYSYNMIRERVDVSKSTLSLWLAHIPYEANAEVLERVGSAIAKAGEHKSKMRLASYKEAQRYATESIGKLTRRDLMMLGLGIYIGEGEKNENVGVINSDPRIICASIRWLTEVWDLKIQNFTLAIHLYPDNNEAACLQYWAGVTGIPLSQFGKTQIDQRKNKRHGKRRKLPYGTAHLRVRSSGNKLFGVTLSRRIHAQIKKVLECGCGLPV